MRAAHRGIRFPREVTGRMVLAAIVGFFAVVFAANFTMATLAVSTFGGVETRNAYQAGLLYSQEIAAARAQEARKWQVDATISPLRADGVTIEVAARNGTGLPVSGVELVATFAHPANRREDRVVSLEPSGSGVYRGIIDIKPGQWDLVVEVNKDGERMFRSRNRVHVR